MYPLIPLALGSCLLLTAAGGAAEPDLAAYAGPSPFDLKGVEALRASPRKVFAHYFSQFPTSIDNRDPATDYYARGYLSVQGENGKHAAYGGYARQRPTPRPPRPEADWQQRDRMDEVRMAIDIRLDGFCYNMLSLTGRHWDRLPALLDAAQAVDPGFKIMLMPDMWAMRGVGVDHLQAALLKVVAHPSVFRTDDDRVVIAPFNGHAKPPAYWAQLRDGLRAEGIEIFFMPTFQGWWKYLEDYDPVSDGFTDWGAGTVDEVRRGDRSKAPAVVRERTGKPWMAPVRPQDFRPRSSVYHESRNSELFRAMWSVAIDHGAEWVQLITWNDYSEGTEIRPSTKTGSAFYHLSAFYAQWFKDGAMPELERDAIFSFYRVHSTEAQPDPQQQAKPFRRSGEACNELELLAFLTAPGRLEIEVGGALTSQDAEAGITSFKVPLREGTPVFRLVRDDGVVLELTGQDSISNDIVFQDLLYRADYAAIPP